MEDKEMTTEGDAYTRLEGKGIRPSVQRVAILGYLLTHRTHPTVEEVYNGLSHKIPKLSHTTVYTTLRMLAGCGLAQMITIDDHHVCYDGDASPHVHFYCTRCGRVLDLPNEKAPSLRGKKITSEGHIILSVQLYYKGVCHDCAQKEHIEA